MSDLLGAIAVGVVLGSVVLAIGGMKNQLKLGITGFFSCLFCGIILGLLLAAPCCAIFLIRIFQQSNDTKDS